MVYFLIVITNCTENRFLVGIVWNTYIIPGNYIIYIMYFRKRRWFCSSDSTIFSDSYITMLGQRFNNVQVEIHNSLRFCLYCANNNDMTNIGVALGKQHIILNSIHSNTVVYCIFTYWISAVSSKNFAKSFPFYLVQTTLHCKKHCIFTYK